MTEAFDIRSITGLSEADVHERLRREGYNELPSSKRRGVLAIAWEVLREPMFLLLIAGGAIYLVLGDVKQALVLLSFVFVVIGITFYQERKTERALEALRDLSSPRAHVLRDGQQQRIPGREVVCGDILILAEGDRVTADAVLLWSENLSVDESLLTGESVPVRKAASGGSATMARPGGEDTPFVYAATLVVQGQGVARVEAIGAQTEIGKIGKALQVLEPEPTLLQQETRQVVGKVALLGAVLFGLVVVGYGVTRGDWLQGLLAGIALAMALLPEEFAVVLTVFLALGAWRLARDHVLTRRVHAIEALGSATVLCVDKTGTLTQNHMTVHALYANGQYWCPSGVEESPPENFHTLVEYSILASERDPFDPMERAIRYLGVEQLGEPEHLHDDWLMVHEYPLSSTMLAMSHVWRAPIKREYVIAAKGAPEAIASLCHFSEKEHAALLSHVDALTQDGMRVLGVARGYSSAPTLPASQHDFDFEFLGLVGLMDPVRLSVPGAIQESYQAGIRVVMITGDYVGTAQYIAREIGLRSPEQVITGYELVEMRDEELRQRIGEVNIFARMVPEQKLRLVRALQANRQIVAMTGDGVNDAPALKAADIGIAMGGRGTDVAREAAALVLVDDDFSSIVTAVRQGRRIFDNLRKAMAYIVAIHIPIAGLSLLPIIFQTPLILLPVHIVFLELIIDPSCSVVFEAEPEEADVMQRPPRNPQERVFSSSALTWSILQGLSVLVITIAVYGIALYRGHDEIEARALTFTTLVIANLCLILTNRSWSRTIWSTFHTPNPSLWWVIGGALFALLLVLFLPGLRAIFHFSLLHADDLLICLLAGIFSILWFEVLKMVHGLHQVARASSPWVPSASSRGV